MSKSRNIQVRGARRAEPDLRKLSRALIALVQAQAEADAQAQLEQGQDRPAKRQPQDGTTEPSHED